MRELRPSSALVLALAAWGAVAAPAARAQAPPPTSIYDARLSALRRASVAWENRQGPRRKVVDRVVLVPDVAGFFAVIATWDEGQWFPILIDDAELAPKFLRAFRPAAVIRYPGNPKPLDEAGLWSAAEVAVAAAWGTGDAPDRAASRASAPPSGLGATPPGIVFSTPTSPSLAGAVALAAGRFQPLVRWEPTAMKGARLDEDAARVLAMDLETRVAGVTAKYASLGDDCDFLTLAAPYPQTYASKGPGLRKGTGAFDDLLARDRESGRRWAYAGRLTGDAPTSVYRAMCALFLQPSAALLFDTYDANDRDFQPFSMRKASASLPRGWKATLVDGARADLSGWYQAIDPWNRYEFVYMNTSGGPTMFNLAAGEVGTSGDLPETVPSVVLMNHSFSASDVDDPTTLAGAWLSAGAYMFFGSLYEPYIQSFRTPDLVASLLADGLPIAAAVRMVPEENPVFGGPWRLHLIGDPLFRVQSRGVAAPRLPDFTPARAWPAYSEEIAPKSGDLARLAWATKTTLIDAAMGKTSLRPDLESALLAIRRAALLAEYRPMLDGLRIDALPRSAQHSDDFLARLASIPPEESTPRVARAVLTARVAQLRRAVGAARFLAALPAWEAIERSTASPTVRRDLTIAMGRAAVQANAGTAWVARLRAVLKGREEEPEAKHLRDELDRAQKQLKPTVPPSIRRGG